MAEADPAAHPAEQWITLVPGEEATVRGRLTAIRSMKRSVFIDLRARGHRIQVRLTRNPTMPRLSCGDLIQATGTIFRTNTGEVTLEGEVVTVIAKWKAEVSYGDAQHGGNGPLCAFGPDAFTRTYFPYLLRSEARQFLTERAFMEVQTPVLSPRYNGGRSNPVVSSYLRKRIGYNRTTLEDRMLALIAAGYERIFEIGSIFRSGKERSFLELYATITDPAQGIMVVKSLLASLIERLLIEGVGAADSNTAKIRAQDWEQVSFVDGLRDQLGIHPAIVGEPGRLASELLRVGVISSRPMSPERLADTAARAIAIRATGPVIVDGFPEWSSPLYALGAQTEPAAALERGRMFLPDGQWGFEFGLQERDYGRFLERVARQRVEWGLPEGDDRVQPSSLESVLAGGLPPVFGFAMSIDRILLLWRDDCSIDPYGR